MFFFFLESKKKKDKEEAELLISIKFGLKVALLRF